MRRLVLVEVHEYDNSEESADLGHRLLSPGMAKNSNVISGTQPSIIIRLQVSSLG